MSMIENLISLINFSKPRKKKKSSVVKDLIKQPDDFKFEAYVENGEVIIKISKRDKANE